MNHQLNRSSHNLHHFKQSMLLQQMQGSDSEVPLLSALSPCPLQCRKWKSCLLSIEKLLSGYGSKQNLSKNQDLLIRYLSVLESEIQIKKKKGLTQGIAELQKEFALMLRKILRQVLEKIGKGEERGRYSKLNTFFKRHLPHSINASANSKQFQTISKYVKQSRNIAPALSRISRKILSPKSYCQSSQCLNCITEFDQDDLIVSNLNQTMISLEVIDLNAKDIDRVLTDVLSKMMNFSIGCLMIGAKKQNDKTFAKGILLSNKDKHTIFTKLMYIRNEFIFPEKTLDEKFQISFLNVKSDTALLKAQQQDLYIVRVYFESKLKNQTYFSIKKWKNSSGVLQFDYRLVRGAKYDENYFQPEIIHKKIYSKYINPVGVSPHPKIQCKHQSQQKQMYHVTVKPSSKKAVKDPHQYGNIPLKTLYHYQSILVLNNRQQNHEKILKNFILKESKNGSLKYFQIYQKFREGKQSLGRQVYYVQHSRRHSLVSRVAKKTDAKEKVLILFNIKNILALIKCEKFDQAYKILSQIYVPYFNTKLISFKSKEGVGQKFYYFKFENNEQSIFAFSLLEYYDIRSKFVGQTKLQDATQITLDLQRGAHLAYMNEYEGIPCFNSQKNNKK